MPSSLLFAINNEGRVHTLSTSGSMWRELPYVGQEFKKLSAVPHFLWALGGDHQVYVYVHGLDIPIRIREEAYENEVLTNKSFCSKITHCFCMSFVCLMLFTLFNIFAHIHINKTTLNNNNFSTILRSKN